MASASGASAAAQVFTTKTFAMLYSEQVVGKGAVTRIDQQACFSPKLSATIAWTVGTVQRDGVDHGGASMHEVLDLYFASWSKSDAQAFQGQRTTW